MGSVQTELSIQDQVHIGRDSLRKTIPLLQALPVPLILARVRDQKIVFSNQQFCSLLNIPLEEIVLHYTLHDLFSAENCMILQDTLLEYGALDRYELILKKSNGIPIKGTISLTLLRYDEEQLIIGIFQAFKVPQSPRIKPSSSENTLLIQNFPGMVYRCRVDEDLTMEFVSQGCLHLTGYEPEELIENNLLSFQDITHPEDRSLVYQTIITALRHQKPFETEYRIITKNGQTKWIWEKGQRVYLNAEKRLVIEGFITDITEHQKTKKSLDLLQNIGFSIGKTSSLKESLETSLRQICEATQWEIGEAWVPNASQTVLECSPVWYCCDRTKDSHRQKQLEEFRIQSLSQVFTPGIGLPGEVWVSKQAKWIPNVSIEPQFLRHKLAQDCELKAGLGVPILVNEKVVAVLVFFMSKSCPRNRRLVELVSTITMQLGLFLHCKEAEAKYRSIVENALEGIFQTTPDGHYINANSALARIYGYDSPQELMESLTDIKHQLYVDSNRRYEFIRLLQEKNSVTEFESQVYRRDKKVIWVSENARVVRNEDGNILYYEGTVEDITKSKETTEKLHLQAFYDPLTGLPNRAFFMDCLKKVLDQFNHSEKQDSPCRFALLFLDLDRFKVVNDSLGHLVGDQLLIAIARRLEHCLREQDTVARLGGDEFTILLEEISNLEQVIRVANRINIELKAPFAIHGHKVFTGASIGILWCDVQEDTLKETLIYSKPEELLRDADTALYQAKALGKGCYAVFDPTMHQNAVQLLALETALRQAVDRQEFIIHYQPIFALKSDLQLVGFEALLRWQHPEQGLLYPQEFLAVAEETGILIAIGNWMLRQVCTQLNDWHYLLGTNHLTVHINLSSKQFLQPDLIENLDKVLRETELPGESLMLEISEGYGLKDSEFTTQRMTEIRERKIKVCIDDFGTGYSCLSYLNQLPINALKIDQSFISKVDKDPREAEIAKTLVMLAHNLGIEPIAEGIETSEQLAKIQEMNCNFAQGYLFSKTLDCEEATALIQESCQN